MKFLRTPDRPSRSTHLPTSRDRRNDRGFEAGKNSPEQDPLEVVTAAKPPNCRGDKNSPEQDPLEVVTAAKPPNCRGECTS
jgi:hypothetical protein